MTQQPQSELPSQTCQVSVFWVQERDPALTHEVKSAFWKTPGIILLPPHVPTHMYLHTCMHTTHIQVNMRRGHAQTLTAMTSLDDVISWDYSSKCGLPATESPHMVHDLKPSGVWGQVIQTHFFFVSDLQVEKSEIRKTGKVFGALPTSQ